MKLFLFLILVMFVLGCGPHADSSINKSPASIYLTPSGDKIIFLDNYYRSYLDSRLAGNGDADSLYKSKIQTPIFSAYFSKSEYFDIIKGYFPNSRFDAEGFGDIISRIENNKEEIVRLIEGSLTKSRKYLQNDSITVFIKPSDTSDIKLLKMSGGIDGSTAGSKQILLVIDPEVGSWNNMIENCVAHEYNHAYWCKMHYTSSFQWTLFKIIISEGKADSYAHLLYPEVQCQWDVALSESEKINLWSRIKPNLNQFSYTLYKDIMFGGDGYPTWGGYTLGYSIMQSVIKNNPGLTPYEWTNLSPEKALEMSDYK